jgi:biotin-(acetyl-CoA carboxylase) ligase
MYLVVGLGLNTKNPIKNSDEYSILRKETFDKFNSSNELLLDKITEELDSNLKSLINTDNYARSVNEFIDVYD